jgi:hypothetical protein
VVEVSEAELEAQADALAWHLVRGWGAPSWEGARRVAEERCATPRTSARRSPRDLDHGEARAERRRRALEEQYSVYDRLMIGAHAL